MKDWSRSLRRRRSAMGLGLIGILSLLLACSPASPPSGAAPAQPAPAPSRTLVTAVRNEPPIIAQLAPAAQSSGIAQYFTKRLFNADLALLDAEGNPQPYLTEQLPELNTDNWK